MFLKRLERHKNGKRHTYWALVESIRTAGGSRHRVVAYLGELTARQSSGWGALGRRLDGKDRPQPTLFDPPRYDEPADDEPVLVNLNGVRLWAYENAHLLLDAEYAGMHFSADGGAHWQPLAGSFQLPRGVSANPQAATAVDAQGNLLFFVN
jgi:hypothetical protein